MGCTLDVSTFCPLPLLFFNPLVRIWSLILEKEKEGRRQREGENSAGCLLYTPPLNLQPRYVPWPRIKPIASWCRGDAPTNSATQPRLVLAILETRCCTGLDGPHQGPWAHPCTPGPGSSAGLAGARRLLGVALLAWGLCCRVCCLSWTEGSSGVFSANEVAQATGA